MGFGWDLGVSGRVFELALIEVILVGFILYTSHSFGRLISLNIFAARLVRTDTVFRNGSWNKFVILNIGFGRDMGDIKDFLELVEIELAIVVLVHGVDKLG